MTKKQIEYAGTTWQDVALCVEEAETWYGVRVRVSIVWNTKLSTGAHVTVQLLEAETVGDGAELVQVRHPFPAKKAAGQAGAVLWAVMRATQDLTNTPWSWSAKMRREAVRKA